MTSYAGNPENWPESFPLISDVSPPMGSDIDVPLEALGDRTAWLISRLRSHLALPGLNFAPRASGSGASLARWAKYNPVGRIWLASKLDADHLVVGTDIFNWDTATTVISGGNATGLIPYDWATDGSGDTYIASATADSGWTRTAAGTIAAVGGRLGDDPLQPAVVLEPTSGLLCLIGACPDLKCWTAPSALTASWTARTVPGSAPSAAKWALGVGNGLLVMRGTPGTAGVYVARSADGGVTWTNGKTIALGFTPDDGEDPSGKARPPAPVWTGSKWVLTASKSSSTARTDVYTSPDAITWTKVAQLSVAVRYLASIDRVICGVTWNNETVVSPDHGTTWLWGPRRWQASKVPSCLAASPYQFVFATVSGEVYPSLAIGSAFGVVP